MDGMKRWALIVFVALNVLLFIFTPEEVMRTAKSWLRSSILFAYDNVIDSGKERTLEIYACMNQLNFQELSKELQVENAYQCSLLADMKVRFKEIDLEHRKTVRSFCGEKKATIYGENSRPILEVKDGIVYDYSLMEKYDCNTHSNSAIDE